MVMALADPRTEAVFAQLDAALDAVEGLELVPGDVTAALDLTRRVERAGRRFDATQVRVVTAVDDGEHHKPDGHATPTVMVAHAANVSGPEAKKRGRVSRALRDPTGSPHGPPSPSAWRAHQACDDPHHRSP